MNGVEITQGHIGPVSSVIPLHLLTSRRDIRTRDDETLPVGHATVAPDEELTVAPAAAPQHAAEFVLEGVVRLDHAGRLQLGGLADRLGSAMRVSLVPPGDILVAAAHPADPGAAPVRSRGRISVPERLRSALGWDQGDLLAVFGGPDCLRICSTRDVVR